MLERTSGLLADLTDCTAMVVGPSHESAAVRSVQLVGLGHRLGPRGRGAGRRRGAQADHRAARRRRRRRAVRGRRPAGRPRPRLDAGPGARPRRPGREPHGRRRDRPGVVALHDLGEADGAEQLFVGGSSRMAAAFDAVDTVRSVLTILEQQLVVVSLLRDILDTGLTVAIGTEHGVEPLASCAIVVMPVSVGGVEAGTIGLLGPTRMNYPLALAAARVVGDRLGERLGEAGG